MITDDQKRVVVIDDDAKFLAGLQVVVSSLPNMAFIKSYESFDLAEKGLKKDMPDIVVLNPESHIGMFKNISKVKRFNPRIVLIALLDTNDDALIIDSIKSGASGIVLKSDGLVEFASHLQTLLQHGVAISKSALKAIINPYQRAFFSPLSDRETQILEQFARGKSYSIIAIDLNLSGLTIKSHMKNIFSKLSVASKADAIKVAKAGQLISTI